MKEMTASEILRSNADDNWSTGVLGIALDLNIEEVYHDSRIFRILADKIEDELLQARNASLRHGTELWAKANGWPDFREGEDFGAWLDRCAIPRPRYDDGEPVQDADLEEIGSLATCYVYTDGSWVFDPDPYEDERNPKAWCKQCGDRDDRVKCPALEVLLGDGKPVSKGETVYVTDSGIERTVKGFGTKLCEGMDGWDGSPWVMFDNGSWMRANDLTHERPVIGADGLPIKDDETVYDVETGEAYIVRLPCAGTGKTFFRGGGYRDPAYLTHTPPDTQERIDEDALKSCIQYWGCNDLSCGKCPALIDGKKPVEFYELDPMHDSCHEAQRLDLLRRQRELDKRTGGAE